MALPLPTQAEDTFSADCSDVQHVTADSDTATLFGCLGNLAELKAQGVDTLVFRTKSRETALDIDTMLSLGAEDTIFTLTHSGSSATLTVGGADHSELIH